MNRVVPLGCALTAQRTYGMDQRKSRSSGWTAMALLLLPVLYVASFFWPVCWAVGAGNYQANQAVRVYSPLLFVFTASPTAYSCAWGATSCSEKARAGLVLMEIEYMTR